jgi:hypothetical protein
MIDPNELSRAQLLDLLQDAAKLWLAHDGLWFQAVEQAHGMDQAITLDAEAWERFTVIEARRIMRRQGIEAGGGLDALKQALGHRLYAYINEQEIVDEEPDRFVFRMNRCRVQQARQRKGLPDFPCKSVGLVEYSGFARTIDERIETRCICCPPDLHPADHFCAWEFSLVS